MMFRSRTNLSRKAVITECCALQREHMLLIRFRDANGSHFDENELQDEDLMGGVLMVRNLNRNEGIIAANYNAEFLRLSQLLTRTEGKLHTVNFGAILDASPEFLTLLITACRKANSLQFIYCNMSDAVCACLMSSMMNPGGITELNIKLREQNVSVYQARLLFHGIASSPSLQKLTLMWFKFEDMDDSVTALEHALRTNQSLKSVSLYLRNLHSDAALENVVRAATGNATVDALNIIVQHSLDDIRWLSLSFLQECLCQDTCSIERLKLEGVALIGDLEDNNTRRNSLLTNVRLPFRSNLACSQAVKFAKSFSSLTRLFVNIDRSSQLVPLDELLLGEEPKLQELALVVEPDISMTRHWTEFFQKLPRMKTLTNLDIPRWIFRSESCRSAFLDALQRNHTLTSIILSSLFHAEDDVPSFDDLYCKMSHLLSLNKGGRQYLQHRPSGQPLAANLWPHVLERAMRIKYISDYDKPKYPKLASLQIDVVYWLLRENLFT